MAGLGYGRVPSLISAPGRAGAGVPFSFTSVGGIH